MASSKSLRLVGLVCCVGRSWSYSAVSISFDLTPTRSSGSRHLESRQSHLSLLSFVSCCSSPFNEAS